jgi:hypothetical protein
MDTNALKIKAWDLSVQADHIQREAEFRIQTIKQEAERQLQHIQNEVTKLRAVLELSEPTTPMAPKLVQPAAPDGDPI